MLKITANLAQLRDKRNNVRWGYWQAHSSAKQIM